MWDDAKSLFHKYPRALLSSLPIILLHASLERSKDSWNYNHLGWKSSLRSSPTIRSALPKPPLNHVYKGHIHIYLKSFHWWCIYHCPVKSLPGLYDPFNEDPWHHLRPFPSDLPLGTWDQSSPLPPYNYFNVILEAAEDQGDASLRKHWCLTG